MEKVTWVWWWKIKCLTYFYNFHFTYSCLFLFVSLKFHLTWKYLIVICLNWNKVSFELLILNLSVESSLYFNCKRVKFKHNLIFFFWGGGVKNVFLFAFQNRLWFFLFFQATFSVTVHALRIWSCLCSGLGYFLRMRVTESACQFESKRGKTAVVSFSRLLTACSMLFHYNDCLRFAFGFSFINFNWFADSLFDDVVWRRCTYEKACVAFS